MGNQRRPGAAGGAGPEDRRGGDAGLGLGDLQRQDRHVDRREDDHGWDVPQHGMCKQNIPKQSKTISKPCQNHSKPMSLAGSETSTEMSQIPYHVVGAARGD